MAQQSEYALHHGIPREAVVLAGIGHLQGGFSNFTWVSLLWSFYETDYTEEGLRIGDEAKAGIAYG